MSGARSRPTAGVMRCRHVMRVIQSYVDGETDSVTAERVAEHLEDCHRCGLEVETYRAIKESLARHERPSRATVVKIRAFWQELLQLPDTPAS